MEDSLYNEAFVIISEAGDARSKALDAIKKIQDFNFEEGEKLIEEAQSSLVNAHKIQTEIIRKEISQDEKINMNILLVHSQDHFAMATTSIDMAKTILKLYKQLKEMKGGSL